MLEKYAVRCGGGTNHRMGLGDAALVKHNHLAAARAVAEAVAAVPAHSPDVPLEVEPSAALASALAESRFWDSELSAFLGKLLHVQQQSQLLVLEPHRTGRIPVVFVHGTASSYGRWADMVNDLQNESSIRDHFEIWLFVYDSGNPIAYSSMRSSMRHPKRRALSSNASLPILATPSSLGPMWLRFP